MTQAESASPQHRETMAGRFVNASMAWLRSWSDAWNTFWFTPRLPHTLAAMRWLTGCVLFYGLLVWTLELSTFFGADGVLPADYRTTWLPSGGFAWSHFDLSDGAAWRWGSHFGCLAIVAAWTIGFQTRITGWLAAAIAISYANRATGALFGFDQIVAFLCLYLAIGRSGDVWSVDAWRRRNSAKQGRAGSSMQLTVAPAVSNQIATRLIQLHLCIVYLFAGLGKLGGEYWLNGEAVWGALASYQYQTLDVTWLAGYMTLINVVTLASLAWEISYAALIWPKLTRPVMLLIAFCVHFGIGLCLGMWTFAFVMMIANVSFVEPAWLRRSNRAE